MVLESNDSFDVIWADAADGERTWAWDQAHAPRPLPPLAAEISDILHGVPGGRRRITVNGYSYALSGPRPAQASNGPPQSGEDGDTSRVWFGELLPLVKASCERLRDTDFENESESEIAGELDGIFAELARNYASTLSVTAAFRGAGSPIARLQDFCREEFGEEAEMLVATMLQGEENTTTESGLALGRIAGVAAGLPEVASLIATGRFDSIGRAPGGETFVADLERYLRKYGWRAESFNSLHNRTWAEEPSLCLELIRVYLLEPRRAPAAAQSRARDQRRETIVEAEAKIDSGQRRALFRRLLGQAETYIPINESRAHWQLICGGLSRRPVMALARKLAARGALAEADDVWFLTLNEVKTGALSPAPLALGGEGNGPSSPGSLPLER